MIGLGIDAGGSSSRWCLYDDVKGELGRGKLEPIIGHIYTAREKKDNLERMDKLLQAVLAITKPDGVVGGITGLHAGTEAAEVFTAYIAKILGLEASHIQLHNDMFIAYASAFAPGEGVLIYAGTGSVGCHVSTDGLLIRSGGCGYLIDDAGAGYWIGHEGIKQVFRWLDEKGQAVDTPLTRAIYETLGSDSRDAIYNIIYGNGFSQVAALAPAVARAAEEGDETAIYVLENAGEELARLARIIFLRLGRSFPTAFAGGIAQLSPILTNSLKDALPTDISFKIVTTEPVKTAAQLALYAARAMPHN